MRAMFMTAASLVICTGLFGCDQGQKVASIAATAAPACNCRQQAQAVAPAAAPTHRHRHHHIIRWHDEESAASYRTYGWDEAGAAPSSSLDEDRAYDEAPGESQTAAPYPPPPPSYEPDQYDAPSGRDEPGSSMSDDERTRADLHEQRREAAGRMPAGSEAWIDGYGRAHYETESADADINPAELTTDETDRRLAPWHAYDSDCDERDE